MKHNFSYLNILLYSLKQSYASGNLSYWKAKFNVVLHLLSYVLMNVNAE